jgi:D-glycero-alpha-D-manno-heptose-7-phosphate kinase
LIFGEPDRRATVIISRTPLRVSFVGGGTDLGDFYEEHGGAVVSSTIDKWVRVVVAPRFEGDVRVSYSRTEIVPTASAVEHELVREALRLTGLPRGVDVITLADVPSQGTGLGSSSAVTVGLLNALYAYQGVFRSAGELAQEACEIEIEVLGKPIGRQDQYAAAYGGFNFIEFMPRGGGVRVEPIICPPHTIETLHRSLMLFYTGRQRAASDVLTIQREAIQTGTATAALEAMRDLAHEMRGSLGEGDVDAVGDLLNRNWLLKRGLADGVSDATVDAWYARAREAGATGGKLLGAGAGGFLLIMAKPELQPGVRLALDDLREVPFHFAARGSQISLLERDSGYT